jgi:hypothetical protein
MMILLIGLPLASERAWIALQALPALLVAIVPTRLLGAINPSLSGRPARQRSNCMVLCRLYPRVVLSSGGSHRQKFGYSWRNSCVSRNASAGQVLFDCLEGGETLEGFLVGFPTISRESAVAALEEAKQLLFARP